MSESIGFVGLGAIGAPIATALLEAGSELVVLDRRAEAMTDLVAAGAAAYSSPAEVADAASIVFTSLPTPQAVRAVACGEDGLARGSSIEVFVDLSTTGQHVAEEVSVALAAAGVACLDSPVSGGVVGAEERRLTAMASGDEQTLERVRPLLETFTSRVLHVGPVPGQGQVAKVLNNLLSATAMAITSEALAVGVHAGLDPAVLLDGFNAGSGRNTATADKFPNQVMTGRFAAGFRMSLMRKDVELCLSEARRNQVPMLLGGLIEQLWILADAQSDEDADHTEIAHLFERIAGVTIAGAVHDAR